MSDIKKACLKCGKDLAVRVNGETHEEFLGCSQYPECEHTEPLPSGHYPAPSGSGDAPRFVIKRRFT